MIDLVEKKPHGKGKKRIMHITKTAKMSLTHLRSSKHYKRDNLTSHQKSTLINTCLLLIDKGLCEVKCIFHQVLNLLKNLSGNLFAIH